MFTGLAYLSTGVECPADGAVTMNGSFVGAGDWTLEPRRPWPRGARRPDPMAGTIRGALGQVKHAYLTAAVVTGYRIAKDDVTGAWTLTGTVADANPYLLSQTPLVFVMVTKGGSVRWPVEAWAMADGQCSARVALP